MAQRRSHHNQRQRGTKSSTAEGFIKRQLRNLSPEALQIAEVFRLAFEGDRSGLDRLSAEAMAGAELLRRRLSDEVWKQGVVFWERRMIRGKVIMTTLRAHPALSKILALDKLLGFTAKDQGLTRRSLGKNDPGDLLAARRRHDEMLRAADKSGLPAPDRELLRMKPS